MKSAFTLLSIIAIACSCKKNTDTGKVPDSIKKQLIGSWELKRHFDSETLPPYPPNPAPGNIIQFYADGSFERRKHDTLLFRGTYTLTIKQDCYSRNENILLSKNEYTGDMSYIQFKSDTLSFATPNCWQDGWLELYKKN